MSQTYWEFYRLRKSELLEQNPKLKTKQYQKTIRKEWKQKDGNGSSLLNRLGTLRYEVIKGLIERIEQYDISEIDWIQDIVNKKQCMYCDREIANRFRNKGDHFYPVVPKNNEFILTNFSDLKIACCADCNSAKGNQNWSDFILKKNYTKNKEVLERLQTFIEENKKLYRFSKEDYDKIEKHLSDALESARVMMSSLSISERES